MPEDGSDRVEMKYVFDSIFHVDCYKQNTSILFDKLDKANFSFVQSSVLRSNWVIIDLFNHTYSWEELPSGHGVRVFCFDFANTLDFSEFADDTVKPIGDKLIDLVLVEHLEDKTKTKYCFRCEMPVEVADLVLCATQNGARVSKVANVMKAVSEPNIEFVAQCIGVKEITGEILGKYIFVDKDCVVKENA